MARIRVVVLTLMTASSFACSGPPSARTCGIIGFVAGGYGGAAGLRSIDTGTDWDSALTGGILGAALLGTGGYFLCKWLQPEDEVDTAAAQ